MDALSDAANYTGFDRRRDPLPGAALRHRLPEDGFEDAGSARVLGLDTYRVSARTSP